MIEVRIDTNERGTSRAEALEKAVLADKRFTFLGYSELIVDIEFRKLLGWGEYGEPKIVFHEPEIILNIELKEVDDYIRSILTGHLYSQVLTLREAKWSSAIILVLGSDEDLNLAVKNASTGRKKSRSTGEMIATYQHLVQDFEANSYALGIPCIRFKSSPWTRLLSHADKILNGGNLLTHRPKPAGNERQIAATCMLFEGIGPKKANELLKKFQLELHPIEPDTRLEDVPGIGQKLAKTINNKRNMKYSN
jgi:ERCC4-type nuclease